MMDDNLVENIRRFPDTDPPPALTSRVVNALPEKRIKGWRRFFLWMTLPRTITITPVKWAPVMLCAVFVILFIVVQNQKEQVIPDLGITPSQATLTFRFECPDARSVALVGTFNNWMPADGTMSREKESGYWTCRVRVVPGRHEYAFLVDGEKILSDPSALFSRLDGFGHYNSVIFATPGNNEKI